MKKRLLIAVLAAVAAISFGAFAGCDKGKVDPSEKIEIALSPQELVLEEAKRVRSRLRRRTGELRSPGRRRTRL